MKREFHNLESFLTPIFTEHRWMMLRCPMCGSDTAHINRVYALEADPDFADPEGISEHGELYGIPVGGIISASCRGSLVIEAYDEHGHHWNITFEANEHCTFIQAKEVVS